MSWTTGLEWPLACKCLDEWTFDDAFANLSNAISHNRTKSIKILRLLITLSTSFPTHPISLSQTRVNFCATKLPTDHCSPVTGNSYTRIFPRLFFRPSKKQGRERRIFKINFLENKAANEGYKGYISAYCYFDLSCSFFFRSFKNPSFSLGLLSVFYQMPIFRITENPCNPHTPPFYRIRR